MSTDLIHGLFHSALKGRLNLRAVKELANIHYWGVSIIPVLLGSALAYTVGGGFDLLVFALLLPAAILMHCVVNAYNHLFDYLRGTDGAENRDNPRYPIMYYGINPVYVLFLGLVYLFLAFLLAVYVVYETGFALLIIGMIGAFVAVFYSGGPYPLSHYPLGELASGFTMGGLIPFAVYFGMTGALDFKALFYALPMILTVGILCYVNNICDIEKDSVNRKTLPILIGRQWATMLFRISYAWTWLLAMVLAAVFFPAGCFAVVIGFILGFKRFRFLMQTPCTPQTRNEVIPTYGSLIPLLNVGYVLAVLTQGLWQTFGG